MPSHSLCLRLGVVAVAVLLGPACGIYSFSGASIPDHLQSVAIPIAETRATGGPPGLDQLLTDALVGRFADRTRLSLEPEEGDADAVVRATIDQYAIAPAAVTGDNVAALNRVSISVQVVVEDQARDETLLDRRFSAAEDFEPGEGLQGEADASTAALEQIAQDAFTAATSDW
ncbi:MAG: LPS assembly lipoprotein LptE [Bacteroidota bacterium]